MRTLTATLLAIVLATAAFACGGKSKSASTTPGGDNATGGSSYGGAAKEMPDDPCGAKSDPCGGAE